LLLSSRILNVAFLSYTDPSSPVVPTATLFGSASSRRMKLYYVCGSRARCYAAFFSAFFCAYNVSGVCHYLSAS
jgi:hypothetical protein